MTPATPITELDAIKAAEEGFLYKNRAAVCEMWPVTQNDGRCRSEGTRYASDRVAV